MKIDHIAIYVNDLEGAKDFFLRYFHATANELYHNPKTGLRTYFLIFPDGGRLEIMTRPEITAKQCNPHAAGYTHLAFSVGSRKEVDRLTTLLSAEGYETLSGPRVTGDGYYESCIRGFEGNLIELTI